MNPTHTPGPWKCNLGNETNLTYDATLWGPAGEQIAVIGADQTFTTPTDIANAKLIAAAPDLLAALQGALQHLVCVAGFPDKEKQSAFDAACAAIAKTL